MAGMDRHRRPRAGDRAGAIRPVGGLLARHDVGSVGGSLHETALDNARGRLLTLGAGLFARERLDLVLPSSFLPPDTLAGNALS
jgi:hypothetical protein